MNSHYLESHKGQQHYCNNNGDKFLIFSKDWKEKFLPPDSTQNGFDYELLDSKTNIIYNFPIYCAYEKYEYSVFDDNYNEITGNYYTLMPYFYTMHHCPCHRHSDAIQAGLQEKSEDFECEGNRFQIISIKPKNSSIILYSEVYDIEELEEKLVALGDAL